MREPAQRQCVVGRSKLFAGRNLLRARHLLQSGAAPALAGQSADLIDEVRSAQAIIEETLAQFFAITARLGGLAAAKEFG